MRLSCFRYLHRDEEPLASPAESFHTARHTFVSALRTNLRISDVLILMSTILSIEIAVPYF
jgi:hypothetical protein